MKKERRFSISLKLALFTIVVVASAALAIMLVSYHFYTEKINALYFHKVETTARLGALTVDPDVVRHFSGLVCSEEFQEIRNEAVSKEEEALVTEWMSRQESAVEDKVEGADPAALNLSLITDYEILSADVQYSQADPDVTYAYLEYKDGDLITVLVDPSASYLGVGRQKRENESLSAYSGNAEIPATIYRNDEGKWLCSAYAPVLDPGTGEVVGLFGVDIDMDVILAERRWFLINSVLFILLASFGIALLAVLISRRMLTNPIRHLEAAARSFASEKRKLTREDVMAPLRRSGDEIEDLGRDIREMEERIIDYSEELETVTAEREHLLGQLSVAVRLKLNLIPNVDDPFPGEKRLDLYADMLPIAKIGGDYYDFFRLDQDHIAVVVADIFKGGTPSALFMVAFKIILTQFSGYGLDPGRTISAVNDRLYRDNADDLSLSAWYGVIELSTGRVTAVNAGHEAPLLIDREEVREIPEDDCVFIIGLTEKMPFPQYEFILSPGQLLFLYTDGVTNAEGEGKEAYGRERLADSLQGAKDARDAVGRAEDALRRFTGEREQTDDITMLCVAMR